MIPSVYPAHAPVPGVVVSDGSVGGDPGVVSGVGMIHRDKGGEGAQLDFVVGRTLHRLPLQDRLDEGDSIGGADQRGSRDVLDKGPGCAGCANVIPSVYPAHAPVPGVVVSDGGVGGDPGVVGRVGLI